MTQKEFNDWLKEEWDFLCDEYDQFTMERYRSIKTEFRELGFDLSEIKEYEKDNPL